MAVTVNYRFAGAVIPVLGHLLSRPENSDIVFGRHRVLSCLMKTGREIRESERFLSAVNDVMAVLVCYVVIIYNMYQNGYSMPNLNL